MDASPTPPKLERSYTKQEWNRFKAQQVIEAVEAKVEVLEEAKEKKTDASFSVPGSLDSVAQNDLDGFQEASEWTKVETQNEVAKPDPVAAAPALVVEVLRHPLIVGDIPPRATRTPPLEDVLSLHTQRQMNVRLNQLRWLSARRSIPHRSEEPDHMIRLKYSAILSSTNQAVGKQNSLTVSVSSTFTA